MLEKMKEFGQIAVVKVWNDGKVFVDCFELLTNCSISDEEHFSKGEFFAVLPWSY